MHVHLSSVVCNAGAHAQVMSTSTDLKTWSPPVRSFSDPAHSTNPASHSQVPWWRSIWLKVLGSDSKTRLESSIKELNPPLHLCLPSLPPGRVQRVVLHPVAAQPLPDEKRDTARMRLVRQQWSTRQGRWRRDDHLSFNAVHPDHGQVDEPSDRVRVRAR